VRSERSIIIRTSPLSLFPLASTGGYNMAKDITIVQGDHYATRIYLYSALPLIKVIVESYPKFKAKFKGKSFVFQASAIDPDGVKLATHFIVENGEWTCVPGKVHDNPDCELTFPNLRNFVLFFSGLGMPMPKIKGFGLFFKMLPILLKMKGLMTSKDHPKTAEDRKMLVKLFFYLLPNGISQLNKLGYEPIKKWTATSPDRAYAFAVTGEPELQSWLRIKAGNSKSGRGEYPRCTPFLTMRFDSVEHALDILMEKGDMMEYMRQKWLNVEGAPEFGAQFGGFLFDIAEYAQGRYLKKL